MVRLLFGPLFPCLCGELDGDLGRNRLVLWVHLGGLWGLGCGWFDDKSCS